LNIARQAEPTAPARFLNFDSSEKRTSPQLYFFVVWIWKASVTLDRTRNREFSLIWLTGHTLKITWLDILQIPSAAQVSHLQIGGLEILIYLKFIHITTTARLPKIESFCQTIHDSRHPLLNNIYRRQVELMAPLLVRLNLQAQQPQHPSVSVGKV